MLRVRAREESEHVVRILHYFNDHFRLDESDIFQYEIFATAFVDQRARKVQARCFPRCMDRLRDRHFRHARLPYQFHHQLVRFQMRGQNNFCVKLRVKRLHKTFVYIYMYIYIHTYTIIYTNVYGARSEGHGEHFVVHGKDLFVHRLYDEHGEPCLIG